MTRGRILQIAKDKGSFEVSWRYRDEPMMKACRDLVNLGLLRRKRSPPGSAVFVLAEDRRDV